jgi:hypothetical protein
MARETKLRSTAFPRVRHEDGGSLKILGLLIFKLMRIPAERLVKYFRLLILNMNQFINGLRIFMKFHIEEAGGSGLAV